MFAPWTHPKAVSTHVGPFTVSAWVDGLGICAWKVNCKYAYFFKRLIDFKVVKVYCHTSEYLHVII